MRQGIYNWKRILGPVSGSQEGAGKEAPGRRAGGREAVFTSVRSEWLGISFPGRRGRGIYKKRAAWLEGAWARLGRPQGNSGA